MEAVDLIQVEIPAALRHLSILSACLAEFLRLAQELPDPDATIYRCQLAVQEIGTNIVEHAYVDRLDGRIRVTFSLFPRTLMIEFEDNGKSFDLASVLPPKSPETKATRETTRDPQIPQERGFGLYVVRQLVDEMTYETGESQNRWRLVIRWKQSE